jgi:acetyl esterase/lipase
LVASCLQSIRDLNLPNYLPQPAGNVQISPWISIDGSESIVPGKIYQDCLTVDMLNSDHGTYFGKITSSGTEKRDILRNPTISPLYGSFVGLCPTLVTYGGTEVFQHDNEKLIQYLKRDQVQVDVIHRPEAPHIWLICWILSPTYAMWKTDCSRLADWCAERVKYKQ